MPLNKFQRINENDGSEFNEYSLNDSTSTAIKTAGENFIFFQVTNETNRDVYIKLQAASADNLKEGIILPRGSIWEMSKDNLYTGEISAIAVAGSPAIQTNQF